MQLGDEPSIHLGVTDEERTHRSEYQKGVGRWRRGIYEYIHEYTWAPLGISYFSHFHVYGILPTLTSIPLHSDVMMSKANPSNSSSIEAGMPILPPESSYEGPTSTVLSSVWPTSESSRLRLSRHAINFDRHPAIGLFRQVDSFDELSTERIATETKLAGAEDRDSLIREFGGKLANFACWKVSREQQFWIHSPLLPTEVLIVTELHSKESDLSLDGSQRSNIVRFHPYIHLSIENIHHERSANVKLIHPGCLVEVSFENSERPTLLSMTSKFRDSVRPKMDKEPSYASGDRYLFLSPQRSYQYGISKCMTDIDFYKSLEDTFSADPVANLILLTPDEMSGPNTLVTSKKLTSRRSSKKSVRGLP